MSSSVAQAPASSTAEDFAVDIPRINEKLISTSSTITSSRTGKNVSAANLFRACYQHVARKFQVPTNVTIPATLNVKAWIDDDVVDSEVVAHTQHFQIGPVTDAEYARTPYYGNLRKALNLSLFKQLSTLIITKQQLDDPELDLPLNLQHLDLSFNRFKHVPKAVVAMKYLRVLKMPHNVLQEVKAVPSLPRESLLEIHLQHNPQLKLIDLTAMTKLQYVQCKHVHPNIQLINFASNSAHEIFIDDHSKVERIFIDQEEEDAANSGANSSSTSAAFIGDWTLLSSIDWIDQLHHFRLSAPKDVSEIQQSSADQMHRFFALYDTAFLLEIVLPQQTKLALAQLQDLCAFRSFFPSFDAIASAAGKKAKLLQFHSFLRFCEANECFLNWTEIVRPSNLFRLFAACRYTLDLAALFPVPNEMHREASDVAANDALFASVLIDRFSNSVAIQRWVAREQEQEQTRIVLQTRARYFLQEIQDHLQSGDLEPKHIDDLARFEAETQGRVSSGLA